MFFRNGSLSMERSRMLDEGERLAIENKIS